MRDKLRDEWRRQQNVRSLPVAPANAPANPAQLRSAVFLICVLALNFQGEFYQHAKVLKPNTKIHPYLTFIHWQKLINLYKSSKCHTIWNMISVNCTGGAKAGLCLFSQLPGSPCPPVWLFASFLAPASPIEQPRESGPYKIIFNKVVINILTPPREPKGQQSGARSSLLSSCLPP